MFNPRKRFERLFEPTEDGYLVRGLDGRGRLISQEEHDGLIAGYRDATSGWWRLASWIGFFVVIGAGVSLELPQNIVVGLAVLTMTAQFGWEMWAFTSPYRLTKGRAPAMPQMSGPDLQKAARAKISWLMALGVCVVSGLVLWGSITNYPDGPWRWIWMLGSGFILVGWLRIAILKFLDRGQ